MDQQKFNRNYSVHKVKLDRVDTSGEPLCAYIVESTAPINVDECDSDWRSLEARNLPAEDFEPEDGFGDYDPELVKLESIDKLPPEVAVGMQFEAYTNPNDKHGSGVVFTVTDVADGKAVLDGNHPWAGKRLRFECQVLDVRPATAEELEHGHVHGPGDHHHH